MKRMIEYIVSNGWSIILAALIIGVAVFLFSIFLAAALSLLINFVGGAINTLRGPKIYTRKDN